MATVTMWRTASVVALACVVAASQAPAQVPNEWPASDRLMVLVKFIPKPGRAASGKVALDRTSCVPCIVLNDPAYTRANPRETVVQLSVPRNRLLTLRFDIDPRDADRAIVNRSDLAVEQVAGQIQIELPPMLDDAIWAPAFATELLEPGMTLRFEHADPVRRAGAYASGAFPALQRRAADNLTFALREAIRRLELGTYVDRETIGRIMVMGFDTNWPAGHTDAPPHVHMHLRWANNVGSQISHFYIGEDGLLTHNSAGIRALGAPSRRFERGQRFDTIDRFGRVAFSHTITGNGGLIVATGDGRSCGLVPSGQGFHSGVIVDCGEKLGKTEVKAVDDLVAGVITVETGSLREQIRYDPATGERRSHLAPLSLPSSALNPE